MGKAGGITRVTAQETMGTQNPEITQSRGRRFAAWLWQLVICCRGQPRGLECFLEQEIDFGRLKSG